MGFGRSFLLASFTVMAPAAAMAADLPSRKAAPVEYVRICSAHGEGFFYIPGTQTCIQIGGRVRAEYRYVDPKGAFPGLGRGNDAIGFRALGRLNIDARTATAYGTLRTFIRYELTGDRGNYGAPGFSVVDKAFIQFAGITAGRVQSFFDFYANDWNYSTGILGGFGSDSGNSNVLAYTATFGGGFSATISLEDPTIREVNSVVGYARAGTRAPDVVGNLLYEGTWGTAQLSAAVHQLRSRTIVPGGSFADTEYGFAIQAGTKINLPMLAAGDVLWLQAAYADGALSYLGVTGNLAAGKVGTFATDALVIGNGLSTTKGWSATAAFTHYWTPTVRSSILGNYTYIDYSRLAAAVAVDTRVITGVVQTVWSPVANFDIGVELAYSKLDPKGVQVILPQVVKGSDDILEARLRFQRDF